MENRDKKIAARNIAAAGGAARQGGDPGLFLRNKLDSPHRRVYFPPAGHNGYRAPPGVLWDKVKLPEVSSTGGAAGKPIRSICLNPLTGTGSKLFAFAGVGLVHP